MMHLMDRQAQNGRLAAHEGQVSIHEGGASLELMFGHLRRNYAGHLLGLSPGQ